VTRRAGRVAGPLHCREGLPCRTPSPRPAAVRLYPLVSYAFKLAYVAAFLARALQLGIPTKAEPAADRTRRPLAP
jgi:hypothetical protein